MRTISSWIISEKYLRINKRKLCKARASVRIFDVCGQIRGSIMIVFPITKL